MDRYPLPSDNEALVHGLDIVASLMLLIIASHILKEELIPDVKAGPAPVLSKSKDK
jgi:hypothetical protein